MSETDPITSDYRPLTPDELHEIARLARFTRRRPVWMAVPLTLFYWPIFIQSVVKHRFPDLIGLLIYGFLGVMTVFWEWQVVVGRRLSAGLMRDHDAGVVRQDPAASREILPESGMDWIVDGSPAPWRGHPPPDPNSQNVS